MGMIERLQMRLQVRLQMPRSISSAGRVPGAAIAHPRESGDASTRGTRQICQSLVRASAELTHHTGHFVLLLRLMFCCFYDSSQPILLPLQIQVDWKRRIEQLVIMAPFMCLLFGKNMSLTK
jgi:hypothetical protein